MTFIIQINVTKSESMYHPADENENHYRPITQKPLYIDFHILLGIILLCVHKLIFKNYFNNL
jgi:hypothetical protein